MGHPPSKLLRSAEASALVSQMRPSLVRYFRRKTGSETEAEDLAQDVIVRSLAHIDPRNPAQARGYIFRSAVNRWRDQRRRSSVRGLVVEWNEATAGESDSGSSPERVLVVQEELECVAQVLRDLEPRTRTIFMLIKFEQMKIASVAEKLGVSTRAVHRHLAKAMDRLERLRDSKDGKP
jgi:RNA polymerase sigma factor (sigma-70 family)